MYNTYKLTMITLLCESHSEVLLTTKHRLFSQSGQIINWQSIHFGLKIYGTFVLFVFKIFIYFAT